MPQRKIRILELARAGRWGLNGSEITRQDIAELAETISGKRPVIIGHDTERAPKFGDVLDCWVSADGSALVGAVSFIEAADKIFEDGLYDNWSISMPKRPGDGKRVLHHLAILGAVPPKIPNLAELAQVSVSFGEEENAAKDRYQFSGRIPEKEDNDTMTEEEKKVLADKEAKIAELEAQNKALKEQAEKKAETPPEPGAQEAKGGEEKSSAEFADLQKQLGELKADRRKERLESFGRNIAGKIPAGVATKAKALAGQIEGVGEFDFADNGKTEKRDALGLLAEILAGFPAPVKLGASGFNYSDGEGGEKSVDWNAAAKKM